MVKALLVAHADDLEGGTDWLTGYAIGRSPWLPQGWGRVNLDGLIQRSVSIVTLDEDHAPSPVRRLTRSGQYWTVSLEVARPDTDVIVALAYTDRYAMVNASPLTVNDLDLMVVTSSYCYAGNKFYPSGYSSPGCTAFDSHNNVELVRIPAGGIPGGSFTVEVAARSLGGKAVPGLDAGFNQDFALYVYNAREGG